MANTSISSLVESVKKDPGSFNDFRTKAWELPDDTESLKAEMITQKLSVDLWMRISMLYYGQSKLEKFEQVTWDMYASMPEVAEYDKLRVLSVLASYYIHKAYTEGFGEDTVERLFDCIKKADRMEARNPELMIAKSNYYLLKKNDLMNYVKYGQRAYLEQNVNSFNPQFIGIHKVASDFQHCRYNDAKSELESIIEKNKSVTLSPFLHLTLASIILETLKENKVDMLNLPFQLVTKVRELLAENQKKNPLYEKAYNSLFVQASQVSALIELKRGKTKEYAQHISEAYKKDPLNCVTLVHMAHILHSLGRFEEAKRLSEDGLRSLKNFISLPPKNQLMQYEVSMRFDAYEIESRFHYYIAFYYHREGDFSNALIEYRAAVELWEQNDMALYALAQVHCSLGEKAKALNAINRVLEHRKNLPESADCFSFFARVFHENGLVEEAKKYYKKTIKEEPDAYLTRFRYAYLLEETESGVKGDALDAYEQGMQVIESKGIGYEEIAPETLNNIALQYLKWRKTEYKDMHKASTLIRIAESTLEKSITNTKGHAEKEAKLLVVKQTLASILEARGKFIQAEEKYREILKMSPLMVDCYIRISELKLMKGKINEAKEVVSEGIQKLSSILKNMEVVLTAKYDVRRSIEKSIEFLFQQEGNLLNYEGMVEAARKIFDRKNPSPGLVLSKARLEYSQKVKIGDPKKVANGLGDRVKEFSNLNRTKTHKDNCYAGQMILIEAALQPFNVSPDFASILYMPLFNDPVFNFNMGVYNFTKELYEDSTKKFTDVLQNFTFLEMSDYENTIYCLVGSLLNKKKEDEEEENRKVLGLLRKLMFVAPERQINLINFLRNLYWCISRNNEEKSAKDWEETIKITKKILRMMEILRKGGPKGDVLHRDAEKLTDSFYETVRPAAVFMSEKLQQQKAKEEEMMKRKRETEILVETQKNSDEKTSVSKEAGAPSEQEKSETPQKSKEEEMRERVRMLEYRIQKSREEKERQEEQAAASGPVNEEKKKGGSRKKNGTGNKGKSKAEKGKKEKKPKRRDDDDEEMIPLAASSEDDDYEGDYYSEEEPERNLRVVSNQKQEIKTDSEDEENYKKQKKPKNKRKEQEGSQSQKTKETIQRKESEGNRQEEVENGKDNHPAPKTINELEEEIGVTQTKKKKKLRRIEADEEEE